MYSFIHISVIQVISVDERKTSHSQYRLVQRQQHKSCLNLLMSISPIYQGATFWRPQRGGVVPGPADRGSAI